MYIGNFYLNTYSCLNRINSVFLLLACNNESVPRTFKEICAVSNSSKRDIGRVFKIIKKEVETNYNSTTPADLIVRVCNFIHWLLNFYFNL